MHEQARLSAFLTWWMLNYSPFSLTLWPKSLPSETNTAWFINKAHANKLTGRAARSPRGRSAVAEWGPWVRGRARAPSGTAWDPPGAPSWGPRGQGASDGASAKESLRECWRGTDPRRRLTALSGSQIRRTCWWWLAFRLEGERGGEGGARDEGRNGEEKIEGRRLNGRRQGGKNDVSTKKGATQGWMKVRMRKKSESASRCLLHKTVTWPTYDPDLLFTSVTKLSMWFMLLLRASIFLAFYCP